MTCSSCGAESQAGQKFCGECGSPLAHVCGSCNTVNPAGHKFCGECGSPLTAAAAAPGNASPAVAASGGEAAPSGKGPVAERRLVSVLFVDLVGFTTLSETRDPESVRELLSQYFETCKTIITRYGGVVEKFIGDAVMAVWGAPVATEDDAERAVRAALELTTAVTALGEEAKAPDLRARAGVLTGEAAVNLHAEGQGMVAGDIVNTASRIQSAAEPGAVFVGETTRRLTEATILFEPAGEFELKGKAGLTPLWRAVRVLAGMGGALRSTGLEPPFVGRDRELRMIKELFHASAEEGKAHLVSVSGIAGIGKSRLSWEFYKYFDGIERLYLYHRGRCIAYGEGVAYWALAEMVKMRCRIAEDEDPASATGKLRTTLAEFLPDAEERRWVEPRLAHLLGLEERATADKEDLFAAWRLFIERMASQDPVVMIFEDLQWADTALLEFIEYLLEWSKSHPIFVLTLSRPELSDHRANWGTGRNFTSIYLEPLPEEPMRELLAGFVPGLPEETIGQILERAQGVPLYAVETVRMLLDRGLLVPEGNVYRPTGPIETLEVPETLHALIAARLDGLTPKERRVVQDGAVLGKTFFKEGLATVSGLPEVEVEQILGALVRKEVLSVQADPRSPERGQYGFLQDLLKTVAYDTLSRHDRRAKHLAAAAFIEKTWTSDEEEIVEVLASHYLRAVESVPEADDSAEYTRKAREMLTKAGDRAASLAAAAEAVRYFEQAIALAEEPLELAELHERAGRAAWQGRLAELASRHLEAAIDAFEAIVQTHPAARVSARLADVMWLAEGRIEAAVERMEAAFSVLAGEEPDADLAALAEELGKLLFFMGRREESLKRLEFALQIAEPLGLAETLSEALNTKGMVLDTSGRHEEGLSLLRTALDIARTRELWSSALRAYNNLILTLVEHERFEEVADLVADVVPIAQRVGNLEGWEYTLRLAATTAWIVRGDWDPVLRISEEIQAIEGLDEGVLLQLLDAVPIHVARGDLERARTVVEAVPGAQSADVQTRSAHSLAQAYLAMGEGRLQEALDAALDAFGAREWFGSRSEVAKQSLALALEAASSLGDTETVNELLGFLESLRPGESTASLRALGARFGAIRSAMLGDHESADRGFRAAASLLRKSDMPFRLAVALLEHAESLSQSGRLADGEPLLAEARDIFERLEAWPWLERLDRLTSAEGTTIPATA